MIAKKTVNTLIASAVALTIAGAAGSAMAESAAKEKCYGVVKAGANDCANAAKTHSCAAHATTDADGGEFIALPAGICERLAGGSTSPVVAKAEDAAEDEDYECYMDYKDFDDLKIMERANIVLLQKSGRVRKCSFDSKGLVQAENFIPLAYIGIVYKMYG